MIAVVEMLRKRMAATWIGYALAFGFAAAIPITNWVTLKTAMGQLRFAALDSRDTVYLSNLATFDTAGTIHEEIARMATETIFDRNPDGYDYEERKSRLFAPAALVALNADSGRDAGVFRDQQIHTKCEIGDVHEIPIDANNVKVAVGCQILRTGLLFNKQFNDTRKATVFFMLTVNNDAVHNGMYPMIATAYKVHFE